ncbi:hypothetical protein J6590_062560 [Homalodisca vitripennis]|nr:hypothetical protein J6590_062560 [Homalodisca vitripennis]
MGKSVLALMWFITHITKIKTMLNYCPLMSLSSVPLDLSMINPGFFLIGDHLSALPQPEEPLETLVSRPRPSSEKLLSSFSVISNWRKLKDMRVSSSDISCINGLRVVLAFLVMITHRVITYRLLPTFNYTTNLEIRNNPWMALLWSSNLATEIFFLIAGIVRAHSFLQKRRSGKQLSIIKQYIQRYFRLTPSMAAMILLSSTLLIHLSNGPVWQKYMGVFELLCNCLWWSNLLHISNCLGISLQCRPETWFLAADFQLFVMSPLLLLPLFYQPKRGLLLLTGVFLLSTAIKTADSFFKLLHPELGLTEGSKGDRLLSIGHFNTIHKVAPFVAGVAVGYFILEVKSGRMKFTLSRLSRSKRRLKSYGATKNL